MSYLIQITNAKEQFNCDPQENILDAAHKANVLISYGCRSGLCGSCEAHIQTGSVEYPDGIPKGLTKEDQEQGKVLLCKAVASSDLTLEARVEKPETKRPIQTLPVKVKQKTLLTKDIIQLTLQLPTTEEPFDFLAGQWFYFVMKDGKKRAFSIANTPSDEKVLDVHIRHANGGVFTDYVFNHLKQGDILKIEGPHGSFFYHDDYRDMIMVAGGTGFAPLKGIIESLANDQNRPKIYLYWGARTKQDLYLDDEVKKWQEQGLVEYIPVLSEPEKEDNWTGKTGFVHQAIEQDFESLRNYAIYMAGPPQMIQVSKEAFILKKARNKNIYYDSFDYSEDATKAMSS